MGIVFACIAPHGGEIIPQLAGDELQADRGEDRAHENDDEDEAQRQAKRDRPSGKMLRQRIAV